MEPSGNATEDTAAAGSGLPALGSADLSTKHEEEPEEQSARAYDSAYDGFVTERRGADANLKFPRGWMGRGRPRRRAAPGLRDACGSKLQQCARFIQLHRQDNSTISTNWLLQERSTTRRPSPTVVNRS